MNFDVTLSRRGTDCIKYDDMGLKFKNINSQNSQDILPMWIADMDFMTLPEVAEAVQKRAEHPIYGYSRTDFSEAVKIWYKRYHYEIQPQWVVPMANVVVGLNTAVQVFTKENDKVIVMPPVYPPFFSAVTTHKRELALAPLVQQTESSVSKYVMDQAKLDKNAKILFLCHPHNPIGRCWTQKELLEIGEFCLQNDIIIVSDEIHADFVYTGHQHIPMASLSPEIAKITVTLSSASKTFNISGLSAAYAVIPNEELRHRFFKFIETMHLFPSLFGGIATKTAYEQGEDWAQGVLKYIEKNRDYVFEFIQKELPQLKAYKPEATYLMWVDFSKIKEVMNIDNAGIEKILLEKCKLALSNGADFGDDNYFRINLATSLENIKLAMQRLKVFSSII